MLKVNFQYPLSDRGLCNADVRNIIMLDRNFQYPLSDRGLCNPESTRGNTARTYSFSILYRIVGSVTKRH